MCGPGGQPSKELSLHKARILPGSYDKHKAREYVQTREEDEKQGWGEAWEQGKCGGLEELGSCWVKALENELDRGRLWAEMEVMEG
jgi:hypothetical protein